MSKTILIADDEASLRLLVKASLKSLGHTIIEAINGQEAYDLALKVKPDIILLDVMMPFMTGFQVCTELRKHRNLDNVPIVILTAKGGDNDQNNAINAGANQFLTKPFRPLELLEHVKKLLD